MRYQLASDNWAGAHPEVLDALIAANSGDEMSYGRDRYTARLQQIIKSQFGGSAEAPKPTRVVTLRPGVNWTEKVGGQ